MARNLHLHIAASTPRPLNQPAAHPLHVGQQVLSIGHRRTAVGYYITRQGDHLMAKPHHSVCECDESFGALQKYQALTESVGTISNLTPA